jgi:hypothetical protein
MTYPVIVTGDDLLLPVQLLKDGLPFAIAGTATVKARLLSQNGAVALSGEVAVSSATAGSDWSQSTVVVALAGTDTSAATYQGPGKLEIQVADAIKETWFQRVDVVRGTIA